MRFRRLRTARRRIRLAVILGVAVAAPAALAGWPAQAGLTGAGWTAVTLPANYVISDGSSGPPLSPVSCAAGTQFCVVIASDTAVTVDPGYNLIGQAALVTTDGGTTWNGYATLPGSLRVTAIACVSASVCWVSGPGWQDQPEVAESTDGGQTWTDKTPASWASADYSWWPNSIDCVSATTCWLVGMTGNSVQSPAVAETTDGGATWTTFSNSPASWATVSNLPTFTPYDPNGTYLLNGISCTSALACVAVGGLNEADGVATVISTVDGGATWSMSTDPTLAGVQQLFSVACLPGAGGLPVCNAAADALAAAGPVEITSADGGTTWSGMETYDNTGWFDSISCADIQHCWAAGAGTKVALAGTSNGGSTWSVATSDTTNEEGSVSCGSVSFCVATTDNGLWYTSNDGGLGPAPAARPLPAMASPPGAHQSVTRALPKVSASAVWARDGKVVKLTGQYRGTVAAKTASVLVVLPDRKHTTAKIGIGLNHYYSFTIPKVAGGTTTVTFTAGDAKRFIVHVHGHSGPAPAISNLSAHAGPAMGGTTLTITGTNFSHVTAVYFGSKRGSHINVRSTGKLTVRAPVGSRAVYVTVVTARGGPSPLTGHSVYNFLPVPVLNRLSPTSGPPTGGTTVTITGTGLAFVKAVYFGTHRGTHLKVLSAREIKIVAPKGTGTVNARIVTAGGTTAIRPSDRYTY